ncbi:MAG: hypothetical protein ABR577_16535 [Pyrinomonadaceae bacterium]
MLFLASKVLGHEPDDEARLRLLEKLQEQGLPPLIRTARLNCYELALADSRQSGEMASRIREMERAVLALNSSGGGTAYVPGELFCFEDHAFFLVFGNSAFAAKSLRAGIVYERRTSEPLRKLDSFCRTVSRCLAGADGVNTETTDDETTNDESTADESTALTLWRQDQAVAPEGFMNFVAGKDADSLSVFVRKESARERVLAAELLEDAGTRDFLRRAKEAYAEGYAMRLAANDADEAGAASQFSVNKLIEAGVLQREILISCRETGHALFTLPSSESLAVVTISEAQCLACGARIADEKIEEVISPTRLASGLLDDGAWLINRLYTILRELGVPESEIAVEPPAGNGEAHMMVNVSGETFLLTLRDGELTPAFARRAIDLKIATSAAHLVAVVTGAVHNEGRQHLANYAARLARGGKDFELIIMEGVTAAALELRYAIEKASQKALGEQLCELDAGLGLSVAGLLTARFQIHAAATTNVARLPSAQPSVTALQTNDHALPYVDVTLLDSTDVN